MGRSETGAVRAVALVCTAVLAVGIYGIGTATAAKKAPKPTVAVATIPGRGAILVDTQGRTLYTLTDAGGAAVGCTGACASAWPPLTVTAGAKTKAPKGVSKISATPDGQVTWKSLPLYRFKGDTAPGQANGEGLAAFGGTWHVVATKAAAATSTSAGS
jgi:predicted lipoprotein with Yx(FWY)xxD motif